MNIPTHFLATVVAALLVALAASLSPAESHPESAQAAEEERAASDSRKWLSSQKACQPGYVPIWTSDKDIECLRDITKAARP